MKQRLILGFVAGLLLCGCGNDEAAVPATPAAVDSAAAGDSVFRSDSGRAELPTHRIYYTLTSHEWYAQGRPLVHGGQAHQPSGMPVSASSEEMTKAGEFEGVEYYTRNDGDATAVYVPVYEGYWQVFRSSGAAN